MVTWYFDLCWKKYRHFTEEKYRLLDFRHCITQLTLEEFGSSKFVVCMDFILLNIKDYKQALLGFEPRISCLLDRHFDQLSLWEPKFLVYLMKVHQSVCLLPENTFPMTECGLKQLGTSKFLVCMDFILIKMKGFKEALLGSEPRISCLLDRRFDQLSHSASKSPSFLVQLQFLLRKTCLRILGEIEFSKLWGFLIVNLLNGSPIRSLNKCDLLA